MQKTLTKGEKDEILQLLTKIERKIDLKIAEYEGRLARLGA